MKIIADKNIPYLKGILEKYGDVEYLAGSEFTKQSVKEADTLIVRTVTYFGKEILEGSNVKLICSATIGYDHIDTKYCEEHGITWKNAPGCNSGSVMQYIISALIVLAKKQNFDLKNKTIGIVGVGNVGKKVAKACELLGMHILLNDPPREETEDLTDNFVSLDIIKKEADIITFHTPLTKEGKHKTYHFADKNFFTSLSKKPVIINSARGGIIDPEAIKEAINKGQVSATIIDCWENEPDIDTQYLKIVDIATPHIAGYSADGKANATRMSLENLCDYWRLSKEPIKQIKVSDIIDSEINGSTTSLEDIILKTYNPVNDCKNFVSSPESFSLLRGNYPLRREYEAYIVNDVNKKSGKLLKQLGFNIK